VARNAQIGDRVADEAGLRLCAAAGRAFVADLAAGTFMTVCTMPAWRA